MMAHLVLMGNVVIPLLFHGTRLNQSKVIRVWQDFQADRDLREIKGYVDTRVFPVQRESKDQVEK